MWSKYKSSLSARPENSSRSVCLDIAMAASTASYMALSDKSVVATDPEQ